MYTHGSYLIRSAVCTTACVDRDSQTLQRPAVFDWLGTCVSWMHLRWPPTDRTLSYLCDRLGAWNQKSGRQSVVVEMNNNAIIGINQSWTTKSRRCNYEHSTLGQRTPSYGLFPDTYRWQLVLKLRWKIHDLGHDLMRESRRKAAQWHMQARTNLWPLVGRKCHIH